MDQEKEVYCTGCGMLVRVGLQLCPNCRLPINQDCQERVLKIVVPKETESPAEPIPPEEPTSSFGQRVAEYQTRRYEPDEDQDYFSYGKDLLPLVDLCIPGTNSEQVDFDVWREQSEHTYLECHFRNIEAHLIQAIRNWNDIVVGCVYTLTSVAVVDALINYTPGCSIIVQKNKWLMRSDSWFRPALERLEQHWIPRDIMPYPLYLMEGEPHGEGEDGEEVPAVEGIRCLGYAAGIFTPKMHNKFLVFCNFDEERGLLAKKVWTGSFNLTATAGKSFENAILIDDEVVATAYLNEYAQICAFSEPVFWRYDRPSPTWVLNRKLEAVNDAS